MRSWGISLGWRWWNVDFAEAADLKAEAARSEL
jgi:hypothetical protein